MPLGSGALAGSNYPIDRRYAADLMDFPSVTQNSLDAVSDRDGVVEVLSALSLIMMHLSRMSEELSTNGEAECIQPNKAFRILLSIDVVLLKGGHVQSIERAGRFPAYHGAASFVELDPNRPGHIPLRFIERRLKHFPLRRIPVAVINQLGIT